MRGDAGGGPFAGRFVELYGRSVDGCLPRLGDDVNPEGGLIDQRVILLLLLLFCLVVQSLDRPAANDVVDWPAWPFDLAVRLEFQHRGGGSGTISRRSALIIADVAPQLGENHLDLLDVRASPNGARRTSPDAI